MTNAVGVRYRHRRHADVKILLICPWVVSLAPLRELLGGDGIAVEIVRVDFEAALRVALIHDRFDTVFYTPTPGLPASSVENAIREHAPRLALQQVDRLEHVGTHLVQAVRARRS
jgi:hypothetical protein